MLRRRDEECDAVGLACRGCVCRLMNTTCSCFISNTRHKSNKRSNSNVQRPSRDAVDEYSARTAATSASSPNRTCKVLQYFAAGCCSCTHRVQQHLGDDGVKSLRYGGRLRSLRKRVFPAVTVGTQGRDNNSSGGTSLEYECVCPHVDCVENKRPTCNKNKPPSSASGS
jgi:hypothetical protein